MGGTSRSGKGEKPVSLSAMEKKYEDIKHMLDGLLGGMPGEVSQIRTELELIVVLAGEKVQERLSLDLSFKSSRNRLNHV